MSKSTQMNSDSDEGDRRRPQRDVIDVAPRDLVVAADDQDQQRADQRQEGDDGEDRPVAHREPHAANISQVISAATPISMAKA